MGSTFDASRLDVAFQPIVALEGGAIVGFEALGRTTEPTAGSPPAMLNAAREAGELLELEHAWRRRAIEAIAQAGLGRSRLRFFLNVDTRVIHDERFVPGFTRGLLLEHDISPQRIVFELTEHDPELRGPRLSTLIPHYRSQGFGIALDDLGAGHASLLAMVQLEPGYVKLEQTIVRGIATSPIRRHLVEAMASFALRVGIAVVAEGIEDEGDLVVARQLGIPYAQGYLLGRPKPLGSWLPRVSERQSAFDGDASRLS